MKFNKELINNEIKKCHVFDLRNYYILIDKFGEDNVNYFFESLLEVANNSEKNKLINSYYPAYLSIDINNNELNTDFCLLTVDKYGIEHIKKYFNDLVNFSDETTRSKYKFFYDLIDDEEIEDENTYDYNTYFGTDSFRLYISEIIQYPVLTAEEEKKYFAKIADLKGKINIFTFNDNYNLVLNDVKAFIGSIKNYEQKKQVIKLSHYLNNHDAKIINSYIELFESINGKRRQDIIVPTSEQINKKLGLSIDGACYESDYFNEQIATVNEYCKTREYVYNCNLRLVISIAKRLRNATFDIEDRTSEGNIGLIKAIEKFDYTKGYKFSTYASWWIKQSITRATADQARTIRIPVHLYDSINKVANIQKQILMEKNVEATDEEIAERTGFSIEKIKEIRKITLEPASLDVPIGEEEDSYLKDFIPYDGDGPETIVFKESLKEAVREVLNCLTDREKLVLEYRYGLNNGRPKTLEEVGSELGVTRERIRQIESKAIRKLRHPNRASKILSYIKE